MPTDAAKPLFLFSVDLEDVRTMVDGGEKYRPRVPEMTRLYLEFLRKHRARCTFFTVGRTALENKSVIQEIIAEGHELACHTHVHRPLTELDPASFRDDLARNIDALASCGATSIKGFRAPTFSLVKSTAWAYEVLSAAGIEYSSSVLPAKNPLFGWKEFGTAPRRVGRVIELPITLLTSPILTAPFAGGVYFRALPWTMIGRCFRQHSTPGSVVLSYFHPYDIDTDQERFMHPGIKGSRFYNALMFRNRADVFPRLERVLGMGYTIDTYANYVRGIAPSLN